MAQSERDRPQLFTFNHRACEGSQSGEEGEDIELSLGLSMNGRFGVDPRAKRLCRSSSIPEFSSPAKENSAGFGLPFVNLARTSSLPAETEEQWRQRKEMQMLRRLEAKRKRSEKQRNLKALKDRKWDSGEITSCEEIKKENGNRNSNGSFGAGADVFSSKSTVTTPRSQGSIGSQGSGSSGTSEESNPVQGMNKGNIEARSPVSVQSLSECEQKLKANPKSTSDVKPLIPPVENSKAREPPASNPLGDMPCVSTKGDGPNGRRIEGFLYKYNKGEEVRIVCVCHGSFLSPAEFVKHAGGGDVTHPLKHIVVNPFPLL